MKEEFSVTATKHPISHELQTHPCKKNLKYAKPENEKEKKSQEHAHAPEYAMLCREIKIRRERYAIPEKLVAASSMKNVPRSPKP